jgi:hypothetical protein
MTTYTLVKTGPDSVSAFINDIFSSNSTNHNGTEPNGIISQDKVVESYVSQTRSVRYIREKMAASPRIETL